MDLHRHSHLNSRSRTYKDVQLLPCTRYAALRKQSGRRFFLFSIFPQKRGKTNRLIRSWSGRIVEVVVQYPYSH